MAVVHQELTLELNADSSEFCPYPPAFNSLLVGTYVLDEEHQSRKGQLQLYVLQHREPDGFNLVVSSKCELPGVLDVKWQQSAPGQLLATTATADGALWVVTISQGEDHAAPCPRAGFGAPASCPVFKGSLALSLDWQDATQATCAALSSSQGDVAVVKNTGSEYIVEQAWRAHELEAWMAVFDAHQAELLYSGADDAVLKGWDLRAGTDRPAFSNGKGHGAGVCCISNCLHQPHHILTGSYDDRARLWDLRSISRPLVTCEVNVGGGVWRLKWHPSDPGLLLAAAMYNGAALLRYDQAACELSIVERYKGHGSITYGADWYRGSCDALPGGKASTAGRSLVATCSFYDRLLHLWSPQTLAGAAI